MQAFPFAHAAGADSEAVLRDCLTALGRPPPDSVGLAFASAELAAALPDLQRRLRESTGIEAWFCGVGMGLCATGREYYDQPALALMCLDLPAQRIYHLRHDEPLRHLPPRAPGELAGGLGLLMLDPGRADATDWLSMVSAALPDCFMVGGLGYSEAPANGAGNGLSGHSGLLFSPDCEVLVDHTQGCSLIGSPHIITKAYSNVVVELDGRPALQVLQEEIGEVLARDLNRAMGYIFAALPVAGLDRNDYQVRNIIGIDRQHQLLAIGDTPPEGGRLQFARRDGNSARDDLEQMLARLRRRAGRKTPRGAVYVSCVGRGRNQFGDDSAELRMIGDALGDIPLVGFFAGGEIYHSRVYAYTGVLTLFV